MSWYQLLHWDFMREAQSKHRLSKIHPHTLFVCVSHSNNWLLNLLVEIVTSVERNVFIYLLFPFVIFQQSPSRSKIGPAFCSSGFSDATALGSGFTVFSRYFQFQFRFNELVGSRHETFELFHIGKGCYGSWTTTRHYLHQSSSQVTVDRRHTVFLRFDSLTIAVLYIARERRK